MVHGKSLMVCASTMYFSFVPACFSCELSFWSSPWQYSCCNCSGMNAPGVVIAYSRVRQFVVYVHLKLWGCTLCVTLCCKLELSFNQLIICEFVGWWTVNEEIWVCFIRAIDYNWWLFEIHRYPEGSVQSWWASRTWCWLSMWAHVNLGSSSVVSGAKEVGVNWLTSCSVNPLLPGSCMYCRQLWYLIWTGWKILSVDCLLDSAYNVAHSFPSIFYYCSRIRLWFFDDIDRIM